jgi:hypothetical protein
MATVTARRRRAIEQAVSTDHARQRVARAVFEVVAGALDLGPIAVRSAEDRAWVRDAIAAPIQHATDQALGCLVDELIDELSAGRPDLVGRILGASAEPWPQVGRRAGPTAVRTESDRDPGPIPARVAVLR